VNNVKKLIPFLVATVLLITTVTVLADTPNFTDINDHWAKDFIIKATSQGIFSGNPDGTFSPERTLNRAELAVIVTNVLAMPIETEHTLSFRDSWQIPAWARGAIATAVNANLLQGRGDGTFAPLAPVTREEAAVVFVHALGLEDEVAAFTSTPGFTDDSQISSWALASIGVARQIGLFSGDPEGRFSPQQPLKRAEAARIVIGFLELKAAKQSPIMGWTENEVTNTKATTTTYLNVRSKPTVNSEKIGLLPPEITVPVQNIVETNGETWLHITFDGKQGYIAAEYTVIKNENQQPEKNEKVIATTTTTLNVRSGPGTSSLKIGSLPPGTDVEVEKEINHQGEVWLQISFAGETAYIAGRYTTLTRIPLAPPDDTGPEDTEPDGTTPPQVDPEQPVKPIDTTPQWRVVNEYNTQGLRQVIPGQKTTIATLTTNLNVRLAPSTAAERIGGLPAGARVNVQQIITSGTEAWLEINFQGEKGYIAGWFTNLSQANQDIPAPGVNEITISKVNDSLYTLTVRGSEPLGGRLKSDDGRVTLQLTDVEFASAISTALSSGPFSRLGATNDTVYIEHQLQQVEAKFRATGDGSLQILLGLNPDDPNLGRPIGWEQQIQDLAGKVILLDAGHGGSDPGAIGTTYGTWEKSVVLDIALKTASLLEARGAQVIFTRKQDIDVSLQSRVNMSNSIQPNLFISIHADYNNNPAIGGSTVYYSSSSGKPTESYRLSTALMDSLETTLGLRRVGVRDSNFYVLCNNSVPAALVETAFLSNRAEENLLRQKYFRQQAAEAIARGIVSYFQQ
jgi:N-acetylmuramoyl-L-alanine amidase